ncbi:MAG: acyl-CoA dehydrogenase [Rickettsiaceae bacterium]|jgi:acyl-CoA dehydrogenase|nr:acyl-CoA dehydrogenase [Rickettsiaceae bacterium]
MSLSFFENLPYLNHIIFLAALFLAYNSFSTICWALLGLVFVLQFASSSLLIPSFYLIFVLLFFFPVIRRNLLTRQIIALIKHLKLLPKISDTEKTVLKSGTVWVDGELFSGKPNFKTIFSQTYPKLSSEEKLFLDNEVEQLCSMCLDHEVYKNKDLSPEVWQYLKEKKFFGMIIPKKYGGLGFSAFAHSCVIQKLSSRSVPLAITAMVPNSLGPAELLLHYGTKEQQDYYLPRLAIGQEVPCFALTEPMAGSDATSITSSGVVFKDENGEIKIRLNWNKRYITLGAVATVIGLAFVLRDPENLLGQGMDIGITCALIPNSTKGVRQGRRHDPLGTPFVNSPLNGEDVVVGLDAVIGGRNGVGKGWKMLMECLAAGRGISLPSTSTGGAKLVTRVTTAYSNIRQQFGISIGKFEGVEKVLARIISKTYTLEAMRSFTAGAVDSGAKPAVVTAIAKYHATEMFREIVSDGMDIMGGSGIIRGKRNLLANAYFSVPISITVEGANIMTRSLIHFGQGAVMCHPFVYKEIEALENNNLIEFDKAFFGHITHFLGNIVRALFLSVSRGYIHKSSTKGLVGSYEKKLAWASINFAVLADIAIIKFGGDLKRKEKINGRFGDILSMMYMAVCALKKFDFDGRKQEEEVLVEFIMKDLFTKMQNAFEGLWQNLFDSSWSKLLVAPIAFYSKINSFVAPSKDGLENALVKNALKSGEFRNNLTKGIYIPKAEDQSLAKLENALILFEKSEMVLTKIKKALKDNILPQMEIGDQLLEIAVVKNIISHKDVLAVQQSRAAIYDAVQVDEYSLEDYKHA